MKKDNFLRMQLIMQDNKATSFETNLSKMVAVVLFNSSYGMTSSEIKNELKGSYDLEFTEEEIEHAVERKNSGIVKERQEIETTKHGQVYKSYRDLFILSPSQCDKYKRKIDQNQEDSIILEFLQSNAVDYTLVDFKELLHNYLYGVFNSNKETLLLFLNKKVDIDNNRELFDFSEEQRKVINHFLNWENRKKDLLIYQTVSYCVEYCLLNVKKGFNSFQNIVKGKKFYLDTNVILRLAGINNEERKTVISSFINKCKENGIQLYYTNYTYKEIRDSIHRNVEGVRKTLNGHKMVSKKHVEYFSKPSTNLDFIALYDSWCKQPGTNYADYASFEKYLMHIIEGLLRQFKKEDFIGFDKRSPLDYKCLVDSLSEYKSSHYANHYEKTVSIDVNNFMYIRGLRKQRNNTITEIKEYLISTDANLCNWSKEIIPGSIPIAVLPSVWYSLILKFQGRSDNDYKAFNLFLNLRFKTEDTLADNQKEKILQIVQNLDESIDIKDLILDDICEKLNGDTKSLENLSPEKIVEDSTKSVIIQEANRLYQENQPSIIDAVERQTKVRLLYEIAEKKAKNAYRYVRIVIIISNILRVVCGICMIIGIVIILIKVANITKIMNFKVLGYSIEGWVALLPAIIPTIVWFIIPPIEQCLKKAFSYDAIKERKLKSLKKELGLKEENKIGVNDTQ